MGNLCSSETTSTAARPAAEERRNAGRSSQPDVLPE
jgi:hypothetical protein